MPANTTPTVTSVRGEVDRAPREASTGHTTLADAVLRILVRRALLDTPGVLEHAAGVYRLAGRSLPRVSVTHDGERISVDAHIAVSWPAPVADVAASARERVATYLHDFGGLDVAAVDITVVDVVPAEPGQPRRRITRDMLAAQRPNPPLTAIHATPLQATAPQWEPTAIRLPEVAAAPPLVPIHAEPLQASSPTTLPPLPVRRPDPLGEASLRPVTATPLHPNRTPVATPITVRDIPTPQGLPVTHLGQLPEPSLTPVSVTGAAVSGLREPHARPLRPWLTPTVNRAAVRAVTVTPTPLRPVPTPAEPVLRPVRITPLPYRSVTVTSAPLREVTVESTPLRPITVRPQPFRESTSASKDSNHE